MTLTADDVFEVLGNRRRRYVFHYLKQQSGPVSLAELTETVAAWETDHGTVDQRRRNSVRTALRQRHLPMMDERGFLAYDPDQQTVALAHAGAQLNVAVTTVVPAGFPWGRYYLGLTTAFGCLVAGAVAGLPLVSMVGELVFAAVFIVLFGISALVHTYVSDVSLRLGVGEEPPRVI